MEAMVLVLCAKTPRGLIRTLSARKLPSALLQGRLPSVEALKLCYVDFNFDSFDYLHRLFFIFSQPKVLSFSDRVKFPEINPVSINTFHRSNDSSQFAPFQSLSSSQISWQNSFSSNTSHICDQLPNAAKMASSYNPLPSFVHALLKNIPFWLPLFLPIVRVF